MCPVIYLSFVSGNEFFRVARHTSHMPSSSRHFLAAALKEIDKHKADARDLQSTIVLLNSKMPPPHTSKLPVSSYILLLTIVVILAHTEWLPMLIFAELKSSASRRRSSTHWALSSPLTSQHLRRSGTSLRSSPTARPITGLRSRPYPPLYMRVPPFPMS